LATSHRRASRTAVTTNGSRRCGERSGARFTGQSLSWRPRAPLRPAQDLHLLHAALAAGASRQALDRSFPLLVKTGRGAVEGARGAAAAGEGQQRGGRGGV